MGLGENLLWKMLNLGTFTTIVRKNRLTHIALGERNSTPGSLVLVDRTLVPAFNKADAQSVMISDMSILYVDLGYAIMKACSGLVPGWPASDFEGDAMFFATGLLPDRQATRSALRAEVLQLVERRGAINVVRAAQSIMLIRTQRNSLQSQMKNSLRPRAKL